MSLGGGDQLARGNVRAQFNPATVSDEKFKEMFGEEALRKLNLMSESDRKRLEQDAVEEVAKLQVKPVVEQVKFRTIRDRVIVTRFEEEEKSNGLYVPDESKEKPAKGIVVAAGPGLYQDGSLQSLSVKVGDKVSFGKFSGAEIQIGFGHYLVLREEDIFTIEENTTGE
jgi:chaperonin GroES